MGELEDTLARHQGAGAHRIRPLVVEAGAHHGSFAARRTRQAMARKKLGATKFERMGEMAMENRGTGGQGRAAGAGARRPQGRAPWGAGPRSEQDMTGNKPDATSLGNLERAMEGPSWESHASLEETAVRAPRRTYLRRTKGGWAVRR